MLALPNFDLQHFEGPRVEHVAQAALQAKPSTIVTIINPRSPGGPHDFSSEGDYWWPNPKNPDGPYLRRDGETNPDNFLGHRRLMMAFARDFGALAAAYDLTHDERYATVALSLLRAWFVDPATRMNPNLQYAQSIKGVCTGRGTGIIDTVHLAEVALGVMALESSPNFGPGERATVLKWFADYLHWIKTHPYGIEERKAENNHGTCWYLQAAAFARLLRDEETLSECRKAFVEVLLPTQMDARGCYPKEFARTKGYGYSLFNADVMAALATVLSDSNHKLLNYSLPDGRGVVRSMEFLAPYLADKSKWPKAPDVMYWDQWPIRQPSLLFAALAGGRSDWLELWKKLPADSEVEEVRRNFPIRYPTLWLR